MQPQTLTVQNALQRIEKDETWDKDMVLFGVFILGTSKENDVFLLLNPFYGHCDFSIVSFELVRAFFWGYTMVTMLAVPPSDYTEKAPDGTSHQGQR
jgi:hypothetical protein